MRYILATLFLFFSVQSNAVIVSLDYTAEIVGSNIDGVENGALLKGEISYDTDDVLRQIGADYIFSSTASHLSLETLSGFSLTTSLELISVFTDGNIDSAVLQNRLSEPANDWFVFIDILEPSQNGWLNGSTELPLDYPNSFSNNSYISAYFTDEFEAVLQLDATILSINPKSIIGVGTPPLLGIFVLLMISLFLFGNHHK